VIILAKDTGMVVRDWGNALCVRHRDYSAPMASVLYEDYEPSMLREKDTMLVVGLSRILTPANRTKVGPHLLRPLQGIRRISLDSVLFIVEPWRAWWHFGCVGARYREYTYSYLAESRWRAAQECHGEDPFSLGELAKWGDGIVESMVDRYFERVTTEVIEVGVYVEREYQALKTKCFDEEHTPAAIIKRLSDFAAEVCPQRSIPAMSQLFKRDEHAIVATNLGVDRWLTGQLTAMVELTNGIARRFHRGGN
jgi:hypothetical protein